MQQLLSPKLVALAIGVSESSLKRWCDRGAIGVEKTPGGHRKIRISEVARFLRDQKRTAVRPELIGLPAALGRRMECEEAREALGAALESGDQELCLGIVVGGYLAGAKLVDICCHLLAPTLCGIGSRWECGELEVFQEHRACEILNRVIYNLRTLAPGHDSDAPVAIGGAPGKDTSRLPSLMVELTLVESGWHAVTLGSELPYASLRAAVERYRPALVWLSLTHLECAEEGRRAFRDFAGTLPAGVPVAVGGRACDETFAEGLEQAHYMTSFQELAVFAAKLHASSAGSTFASRGDSSESLCELIRRDAASDTAG
ncbi:hypothetical protein Pla175_20360 [Pirellulimonas nuda]|uniref:B12 binding domain protein n=1 Tax=Pirellulimonas nuda TaxID=2528009 RepID=A0A518DB45_9BACT|nr:B12-binding domain-containing protein [Pirellulimonas nuda]QDU88656.1 hypothetical protein Pla175_20360 [Pirellulimonas nuda]